MKTHRKIEREWWFGLRRPKLYGKTQQPTESRRSRWWGPERRCAAGVERVGGRRPIVWGDDWSDEKNRGAWCNGLRWPKLYWKKQQSTDSRGSRLGGDGRGGAAEVESVGGCRPIVWGNELKDKKIVGKKWGLGLRWPPGGFGSGWKRS
jgi:hypothetical protein